MNRNRLTARLRRPSFTTFILPMWVMAMGIVFAGTVTADEMTRGAWRSPFRPLPVCGARKA
ncbi:hypothetical protein EN851_02445 [Mesorhizobium sp. M8A.F.Ca.ET.208.01.1.1]|nr:MAG: hypothetical protein EOS72_12015 [Mesorhizobium sp.]TGQ94455.1 hypothetical protein EN851_02445 [Mesorhizobium sp. M8A.F.Ca.ET.208.01.1.1]TGT54942.1 hypothetical protein EN810_02445 [Mesorhizobium sp. M8A.F.Ca.ET.167.01.1.1]